MPTDELENELRTTLAKTAADFVSLDQARQRLLQRDYHPRRGNRPPAAGIIAGAAGMALVLGLGLSGAFGSASHQPSHLADAELAAWTVVKQPGGTVNVKIREFRNPAGLQAALRADGVPASVILLPSPPANGNPPPGDPCHGGPWSNFVQSKVVTGGPFTKAGMFIHLSALPRHAGIQLVATANVGSYSPQRHGGMFVGYWLVEASPQCTGS
jgi:hypothetical protein